MTKFLYSLLQMSIMAGWLIIAVVVLRLFLKKVPRRIVCLLWALVAIRLIFPFTIESSFSLQPGVGFMQNGSVFVGTAVSSTISVNDDISNNLDSLMNDKVLQNGNVVNVQNDTAEDIAGSVGNQTGGITGNETDKITQNNDDKISVTDKFTGDEAANRRVSVTAYVGEDGSVKIISENIIRLVAFVWLGGMSVLLLYALVSYIRLRKHTVASINVEDNIYLCDDINTPFILGAFQPKIYIPSSLGEDMREYVLAHEKAHLKYFDNIWKPFGYILLCVHWFNPLVWIFYILLCKDIEIACDERVISDKDTEYKKQYATALLSCSVNANIISACPLTFGEVSVKERIRTVLNYKKPACLGILAAIVLCIVVAVGFMTNPKQDSTTSVSEIAQEDLPDYATESASHINEEPENMDGALPVMEQLESADDRIEFLTRSAGYSESYKYAQTGKRMFDCYAAELSEKNPEKYEKLKEPVSSLAAIMDVEQKSAEVFYGYGSKVVVLHLPTGDDIAAQMLQRGELWIPFRQIDGQSDNYAEYREYDRFIDELTADKIRDYDDKTDAVSDLLEGDDYDFVVLDSIEEEDTVLYGSCDVFTIVLRRGDQIIPVPLSWTAALGWLPEMYAADYDNDGRIEYAIKICTDEGTGVSGSELYIIETDWQEDENGKVLYTLNRYQTYYSHQELDALDFQYDDEKKTLTVLYNDEISGALDLSMLEGDYKGVAFGNIYGVDYVDGVWYFTAKGGISTSSTYMPVYDWNIIFEGRIVYDGQSFHLEDVQVHVNNSDSE